MASDTVAHNKAIEIRITLGSEEQARAVERALDLYSRLSMGQLEEIAALVRLQEIKASEEIKRDHIGLAAHIEQLVNQMKDVLGHPWNGSFGIGNQRVSTDAHRCYEIKKVLQKALAVHREPKPKFRGVDYDGLWRRFTKDPEPIVEVKNAA